MMKLLNIKNGSLIFLILFIGQNCLDSKPNFRFGKTRKRSITFFLKKIEKFLNCLNCVSESNSFHSISGSEYSSVNFKGGLFRAASTHSLIDSDSNKGNLMVNSILPWLIFNGLSPRKPERCAEFLDQEKKVSSISRVESGQSVEVVLPRTDEIYKADDAVDLNFQRMACDDGAEPAVVPFVEKTEVFLPIWMLKFDKDQKKGFVEDVSTKLNKTKEKFKNYFGF